MSFDRKGSEFDRKGRVKLNEFDRKGRQKGGGGLAMSGRWTRWRCVRRWNSGVSAWLSCKGRGGGVRARGGEGG